MTIADDRAVPPGVSAAESPRVEPLGTGWLTVTVLVGVMAALIALGGMVLSFRAVSQEMIPAFGARWAWLVPVVVDLTVFVFSGVDLVLARLDMSHPLARWTVYAATAGTVYLNYAAGGTPAGRVAHVLMPSIWVVFIELMRHVVRRQVNLVTANHREPIPSARWLLSPWPTLKLWRRMVLWRVNSYPVALDQEKGRLGAIATAREVHGRFWRWRISPLTRLQINLGELDADGIRGPRPAQAIAPAPGTAPAFPIQQAPVQPAPQFVGEAAAAAFAQPTAETVEAGVQPVRRHAAAPGTAPGAMPNAANGSAPGASHAAPPALAPVSAAPARPAPYLLPSQRGPLPNAPTFQAPPPVPREPQDQAAAGAPPAGLGEGGDPGGEPNDPGRTVAATMSGFPTGLGQQSELLVAAREVDRWRGQPSANRIGRELGVGPKLAAALADALRAEDERSYR